MSDNGLKLAIYVITVTGCFLLGIVAGALLAPPDKAKVDMLVYTSIRLGWVCHDNNVSFDECIVMHRNGTPQPVGTGGGTP